MANAFVNSIKLLKAINLLASPSGTTVKKLMSKLDISRRTAFRLLSTLEELGIPLIDDQPGPRIEKTYHILESYVLKLPNMAVPNPGFTRDEISFLLTMLDFWHTKNKPEKTILINAIRQKIIASSVKYSNGAIETNEVVS
jgi:predicted DNA-binding transcriptional regulator YafY